MKKTIFTFFILFSLAFKVSAQFGDRNLQYWIPPDKRGINQFETSKLDTVPYEGVEVRVGGAFALQFQALDHENTAIPNLNPAGVNTNELINLTPGFNTATANLNLDVQLAPGLRMSLITYLSSRHHPEAWVKGGYLQIDEMPWFKSSTVDNIMDYLTLRVGHMEINYGDAHFRRTDNGNALMNPFVGNYIMDAFTTEIGGELYFKTGTFFAMAGATAGEIQGNITSDLKSPAFLAKLGYDASIMDDLRLRLTGSLYTTSGSASNTLYGGDRGGSRYYLVMENVLAVPASQFTSGRFNPGFRDKVTAFVINPFIKFNGFEFFGNFELASGRGHSETDDRNWTQLAGDLIYRFGGWENFYVGARYNTVSGELAGSGLDVSINRIGGVFGWFITSNVLAKLEYVNQTYNDFAPGDIRNGGEFSGIVIEGAIAF